MGALATLRGKDIEWPLGELPERHKYLTIIEATGSV